MKRDRESQKYCGLLNKAHCFTVYYQNKRHETGKTFEREKKRILRGHRLRYTALPPPSSGALILHLAFFFFTSFINFFYCYLKVHINLFYCYFINISLIA